MHHVVKNGHAIPNASAWCAACGRERGGHCERSDSAAAAAYSSWANRVACRRYPLRCADRATANVSMYPHSFRMSLGVLTTSHSLTVFVHPCNDSSSLHTATGGLILARPPRPSVTELCTLETLKPLRGSGTLSTSRTTVRMGMGTGARTGKQMRV